jgi:hypothetical protein
VTAFSDLKRSEKARSSFSNGSGLHLRFDFDWPALVYFRIFNGFFAGAFRPSSIFELFIATFSTLLLDSWRNFSGLFISAC